jgi:chaperonin GroEL (HSP60 family)
MVKTNNKNEEHKMESDKNNIQFTGSFSDMKISDIGFGINEYKTSKPNIVKNDAIINEIINISDCAETAIGHTIGPYADETLIQTYADNNVPLFTTRDGYTILSKMRFTQAIPNGIFKILKETSEFLQNKIGDSTSSGIPIQNSLLKKYIEIFHEATKDSWVFSPVGIKNISYICVEEIINGITNNPKYQLSFHDKDNNSIGDEKILKWLAKVATISANNDYVTGAKIANLYKNKLDGRGDIITTTSKNEEEYIEETNAFVIPQGLIDNRRMSNSSDGLTCEFKNPVIAVFDGQIMQTDIDAFKQIVEVAAFKLKKPIFICAGGYNTNIASYMISCLNGNEYNEKGERLNDPKSDPNSKPVKIQLAAITLFNKELMEQYHFDDVVLMTGCKPFSTELTKLDALKTNVDNQAIIFDNMFGHCDKISSSFSETFFFGCKPDKVKFDFRINELKTKLENMQHLKFHRTDMNQEDIIQRLNRLESKTTIYYCGGRTDKAKYSRKFLIEDATSAVKSAIKNDGVSIGGNMAICHYIHHNFDTLRDTVIEKINSTKINITAAENFDRLSVIVESILSAIEYSFGQAYRYALYNMYRDPDKAFKKWEYCINSKDFPIIYNIMTNKEESFEPYDVDNCTTIIVPKDTDKCLLMVVVETVCSLINIGNMITLMSPGLDLEALQIKQLESGAAYQRANTIGAV